MLKYVLSLSFSQDCCVFAMGASLYPFTLGSRRDKVRPAGNRIQVRWEPINQGIERRFSAALVDGVCGTDDSNRRPREREVLEGINSAVGSSAIWAFGDNAVGSSRLETCSCTSRWKAGCPSRSERTQRMPHREEMLRSFSASSSSCSSSSSPLVYLPS